MTKKGKSIEKSVKNLFRSLTDAGMFQATVPWDAYDMTTGEKKSDLDILANLTNRLTLVTQEPSPGKTKGYSNKSASFSSSKN